jgi:hypothetical protein
MFHGTYNLLRSSEHGDEPWDSIKVEEIFDHMKAHQLLKKGSALRSGKVNFPLYLIQRQAMKSYGEVEVKFHHS